MSLFGSLYEEAGDSSDAPAAAPAPAPAPAPAEPAGEPGDHAPGAGAGSSSMSLQDFAAEVFGGGPSSGPDPAPDPGSVATLETELSDLISPPETDASPSPAASEAPEATDPPPSAFDIDPDNTVDGGLTLDPAPVPVLSGDAFDTLLRLDDDLLPAHKPKRGVAVPSLDLGRLGRLGRLGWPIKLLVVLLVVGVAGFVGSRALAGGGDGEAATDAAEGVAGAGTVQLGDLPVSGALDPRDAGAVINSVQLVGAEAELRTAAVSAQAHYAETGSFALPAAEWTGLVGRTVVDGASGAPAPGVLRVVSDDDAVCFETATDAGATAAVGVTDGTLGFAGDPAGGPVCTLDAAVLSAWPPSLAGV